MFKACLVIVEVLLFDGLALFSVAAESRAFFMPYHLKGRF
jgi:hypothetical protein